MSEPAISWKPDKDKLYSEFCSKIVIYMASILIWVVPILNVLT
jgi:hypothetical protein